MEVSKDHISIISSITLWISIIIFVLVTMWIIQVFDSQDNQDQDKLDRRTSEQVNFSS
jgi:uncharacterized membrane protein